MGQTSFPPNAIIVTSAGLIGASASGAASTLSAADARTLLSVYSTAEVDALVAAATAAWGDITGTLGDQTDLQAALDAKASLAGAAFTGAVSGTTAAFTSLTNSASSLVLTGGPDPLYFNDNTIQLRSSGVATSYVRVNNANIMQVRSNGTLSQTYDGNLLIENSRSTGVIQYRVTSGSVSFLDTVDTYCDIKAGPATFLGDTTLIGLSSTSTERTQAMFVASWVSSTDASRKAQLEMKVFDTAARTVARYFADGSNGYFALKAITSAPADADLQNSEIVFYDNAGTPSWKFKNSSGTVTTGTL